MADTTPDRMKALMLRVPPTLHAQVKAAAARDHRSLNAELLYLIQTALAQHDPTWILDAWRAEQEDDDAP